MRIFLAIEIAGEFARLKKGLIELGHSVTLFAPDGHLFNYGGIDPPPEKLVELIQDETIREIRWLELRDTKASFSFKYFKRLLSQKFWLVKNLVKFCAFASAYDVFAFNYGNSLHHRNKMLKFNDLFLLRLLGKTVIFRISGSEARPAYLDGYQFLGFADQSPENVVRETKATRDNNCAIEKYASYIIANKFTTYFISRPVIPLQTVGTPIGFDIEEIQVPLQDADRPVVVLHAPSRQNAKNTVEFSRIIEELKREGLRIDFRILAGRPNEEVISEIRNCDFVIDQMYSDLALASFAAEAAYYAKPAVVGGYLTREQLELAYNHWGVPPSEYCHPSQAKDAIRRMISDQHYRLLLGEQAKQYVRQFWSPHAVAERWERLFRHDVPNNWFWHPITQNICPPVCISEADAGKIISSIIEKFGTSALCLDDKPILKRNVEKLGSLLVHRGADSRSKSFQ